MRAFLRFVTILALASTYPITVSADEPSYVLECQGGGPMKLSFYDTKRDSGNKTYKVYSAQLTFSKAAFSASQQPLAPGSCAWLDRPVRAEEPTAAVLKYEHKMWPYLPTETKFVFYHPLKVVTISKDRVEFVEVWHDPMRYLVDNVYQGRPFRLYVHRDGKVFVIDRAGP